MANKTAVFSDNESDEETSKGSCPTTKKHRSDESDSDFIVDESKNAGPDDDDDEKEEDLGFTIGDLLDNEAANEEGEGEEEKEKEKENSNESTRKLVHLFFLFI